MIAPLVPKPDPEERIEALVKEVSASRLNLWGACRLKFYFRYVLQLEKPTSSALHLGKVVHAGLQAWNLARWRGEDFSLLLLKDHFLQKWKELQEGQVIDWKGKEEGQRDAAWRLLDAYLHCSPIPKDEKPEGVEVQLETDLESKGLPNLIGVIDLVRAGGQIVDFKTTNQTPDREKVVHQTETQLTCYAVLYRDATGKKEGGFELHHLVKIKKPKLVVAALIPATEQQMTKLFRRMESYVEGVSRQDFVPSPGLQCSSCEFFKECRRWS